MAKSGDVKLTSNGIAKLLSDVKVQEDLERRAKKVADACNAESEWGGYYSGPVVGAKRASAHVWNIKRGYSDDEDRNNRMIHNLDEGR